MTPHQADVAFVLESVPGLMALYAIEPGTKASGHFDFAVQLEQGGRCVAAASYALLRVLTHDECARVFLFHADLPSAVAEAARPLVLTSAEREAARARVPPPEAREEVVVERRGYEHVLIVDDDPDVAAAVRSVRDTASAAREREPGWLVVPDVNEAVRIAQTRPHSLILCDAKRAFGMAGLLAKLPLATARRVLVLASPTDLVDARWRLQGIERIVMKPLEGWILYDRIVRASAADVFTPLDLGKVTHVEPRRKMRPPASAPFSALLVDVDDDVHEALRRLIREDARHLMRRDPEEAAEVALSTPFHFVACSANAALHSRSFLQAIARDDPDGADRVVVLAPARDVPYVKHKLAAMRRRNTVLASPLDDTILRREVFRDQEALAARVAVAEAADVSPVALVAPPRFRRLGVLVVDDDVTTEILFAAGAAHDAVDVTLAQTTMAAFEHVVERAVDLLVVSATMRGDGGEPFYRVLWRLEPELKSRSVLITPANLAPKPAAANLSSRVLERPVTRAALAKVVETFARR